MTHPPRVRILIVDDDKHVLAALRRQLRHRYDVVLAEGAAEGILRLRQDGPFAVVLSDLHMPGVDGLCFLAMVRAEVPHVAAVLLTGSQDIVPECAAGGAAPAVRCVRKPCAPEVLWSVIDDALGGTRGTDTP